MQQINDTERTFPRTLDAAFGSDTSQEIEEMTEPTRFEWATVIAFAVVACAAILGVGYCIILG